MCGLIRPIFTLHRSLGFSHKFFPIDMYIDIIQPDLTGQVGGYLNFYFCMLLSGEGGLSFT